jgi:hypothetical protein
MLLGLAAQEDAGKKTLQSDTQAKQSLGARQRNIEHLPHVISARPLPYAITMSQTLQQRRTCCYLF